MSKEKIDGRYDYFAFISYTEENTKKAQWLKDKLTHYEFPKDVREERTDLPSWIRPVFEWKTDTSGGDLRGKDSQIKKALFNSKYLIVICSPQAVTSEPVNGEIQDFINWGREKYIIPFIVDGKPHANNPEEECFPPALLELGKERERKGIFIDNINEDYAKVSVISTMFNIEVNDLWKPYERELRRKRRLLVGCAFLFAVIGFSVGLIFHLLNKDLQISVSEALMAQSRAMAEKSTEIPFSVDLISSMYLALSALPSDLENPDRPYTPEAELALRKAYRIWLEEGFRCYYTLRTNSVGNLDIDTIGKKIAYVTHNHGLWIYDMVSDKHYKLGDEDCYSEVSFSPNGKYVVASMIENNESGNAIRIWNVEERKIILSKPTESYHSSPNISPKEDLFITTTNGDFNVFDFQGNVIIKKPIKTFARGAFYSPNGKKVAICTDSVIYIYDLETSLLEELDHKAFSHYRKIYWGNCDDKLIVLSDSCSYMYNIKEKSLLYKNEYNEAITAAVPSYNDHKLYIFSVSTLTIIDSNNGEVMCQYPICKRSFLGWNVVKQQDRFFVTGCGEGIQYWKITQQNNDKDSISTNIEGTREVYFDRRNSLISIVGEETTSSLRFNRVYSKNNNGILYSLTSNYGYFSSGLFSKDNKYYVTNKDSIIFVVDNQKSQLQKIKNDEYVRYTEMHPFESQIASLLGQGKIIVRSISQDTTKVEQCFDFGSLVTRFKYSNDGRCLVVLFRNSIEIFDIQTRRRMDSIKLQSERGADIILSPKEEFALIVGEHGKLQLWNLSYKKCIWKKKLNKPVWYSEFSHDGKHFLCITCYGNETVTCKVFNTSDGGLVDEIEDMPSRVAHFGLNDTSIITSNIRGHIISHKFLPLADIIKQCRTLCNKMSFTEEEEKEFFMK